MKKKKLKLDQLKIKSFVTELDEGQGNKVIGGNSFNSCIQSCLTCGGNSCPNTCRATLDCCTVGPDNTCGDSCIGTCFSCNPLCETPSAPEIICIQ